DVERERVPSRESLREWNMIEVQRQATRLRAISARLTRCVHVPAYLRQQRRAGRSRSQWLPVEGCPRVVFRRSNRLIHATHSLAGNFGREGSQSEGRVAGVVIPEVRMVEGIDQVHPKVDATPALLGKDRPRKVFRECKIKKLLPRRANVQRARCVA